MQENGTFGSVDYHYRIGKYEVTNAQYAEFLNAVATVDLSVDLYHLYTPLTPDDPNIAIVRHGEIGSYTWSVKPGFENKPVVGVTFLSAARFANWLHNGQPTGGLDATTTEDGAYTFDPEISEMDGRLLQDLTRNPDARWFMPTEDEWYKAAYHKNDGVTANYWDYPTSSDRRPYSAIPPGTTAPDRTNTANFDLDDSAPNGFNDGSMGITDVGAYLHSPSPYGTFDQGGNVNEWTESYVLSEGRRENQIYRGGSYSSGGWEDLAASFRGFNHPGDDNTQTGFRVATIIPEPSSLLLALVALPLVLLRALK